MQRLANKVPHHPAFLIHLSLVESRAIYSAYGSFLVMISNLFDGSQLKD